MAREIQQIMEELESAYAPQKKQYQEQISALPSYYATQAAGLEQARQNAFQDIVRRANARGVVYSGAPIQEQQVYTGERYLPALAGLRQQESGQAFTLQQALGKIGETQRLAAEQIRQQELNREEAARQAEANRRAAGGGGGFGGFGGLGDLFGGGGGAQPQAQQQAPQQTEIERRLLSLRGNTNPYVWADAIRELNRQMGGSNWGQTASFLERILGQKIGQYSAIDLALKNVFTGAKPENPALIAAALKYQNNPLQAAKDLGNTYIRMMTGRR